MQTLATLLNHELEDRLPDDKETRDIVRNAVQCIIDEYDGLLAQAEDRISQYKEMIKEIQEDHRKQIVKLNEVNS